MQEATKKVLRYLREIKQQKDMTCQTIVDACEAQGVAISLSTVRRFFSVDSENGPDYRPYTVNALVRAMIGTEETVITASEAATLSSTEREILSENSALKAATEMHNAVIAELNQQITALKNENAALERTIADMQIRLDTMADVIRLAMESLGTGASQHMSKEARHG